MIRTHNILKAYAEMCLWQLPFGYTEEQYHADAETLLDPIGTKGQWLLLPKVTDAAELIAFSHPWFQDTALMDKICEARGITRRRFIESRAFPKPSRIENLIYCDEIRKHFGNVAGVAGFGRDGVFEIPAGNGIFVPMKQNGLITSLRFYAMAEVLRPQGMKRAA